MTRRLNHRARSSTDPRSRRPRARSTREGAVMRAIAPSTRTLSIMLTAPVYAKVGAVGLLTGISSLVITWSTMSRALAVVTACLLLSRTAAADAIDQGVRELQSSSQKVRLAAALGLSKSKDARAVLAVSGALNNDSDPTIRRGSALALEKMIDASTAEDARELALDALERAARSDKDAKVKTTAATTYKSLAGLRKSAKSGSKPTVFVNVDSAT